MVEIGEAPPQEKSPLSLTQRYAFALAGASPETQARIDDINVILEGVSAFHSWSTLHEGDQPTDLSHWFNKLSQESQNKHELLIAMRGLSIYTEGSGQERESLRTTIQQALPTNLPPATIISKENPVEIDALQKEIGIIIHDVGNPLAALVGYSSLAIQANDAEPNFRYKDLQPNLQYALTKIRQTIETENNMLINAYPKESLTLPDLIYELKKHFTFTPTNLEITLPKDAPDISGSVQWSTAWLKTLADNVIQNTEKAYRAVEKTKKKSKRVGRTPLTIKFAQNEDADSIDILFDDAGTGFPADIVEHGFQTGKTHWKGGVSGTGTGMAFHAAILEEKYGAKLIPTNRVNAKGAILGGRLIVRLPLLH